jgi:uncharacterized protein (DUF433 family)
MTMTASWISKKPDRCGGDACFRETRIPVWVLVNYRRLGASDADVLRAYPGLTPADLEAAWEYAAANLAEIDRAIRENEEGGVSPSAWAGASGTLRKNDPGRTKGSPAAFSDPGPSRASYLACKSLSSRRRRACENCRRA